MINVVQQTTEVRRYTIYDARASRLDRQDAGNNRQAERRYERYKSCGSTEER